MRRALRGLISARYELMVESQRHAGEGHRRYDDIGANATKEFFTLLALSAAQVDMYRRLRNRWPGYGEIIDAAIKSDLSDDCSRVVRVLRNHYTHVLLSELSWSVTTDFGPAVDRHGAELKLDAEKLILTGAFDSSEIALLKRIRLSPIDIFDEYLNKIKDLWDAICTYSRSSADPFMANYFETETAIKSVSKSQWWNVVLQNFVGKSGVGVYQNLYRFFTEDEISGILRRADHSDEQADYAIALKDEHNACDDALRQQIRALFRTARPRNGP